MAITDRTERWHVGKEIPLALIAVLIVQSFTAIWWAAQQTIKLDNLLSMVAEFRQQQYTQTDARRDMETNLSRHAENRRRIEVLENQRERGR